MGISRMEAELRMEDYKKGYSAARRKILAALRKEHKQPNLTHAYKRWTLQIIEKVKALP